MSTTPAAAPTTTTPSRSNSRLYIIAAVFVLAVFGGTYLFMTRGEISTDDAQIDGRLVPVAPKVSGYISQLLVDDNQIVTKGQVIARIDPRDRKAELDRAQASLDSAEAQAEASTVDVPLTSNTTDSAILAAEANLSVAQAQLLEARRTAEKSHNADISVASAELSDRKANYERAHADLGRMQTLIAKKEISSLQFDRYAQAERSAQGQLDAAEQTLAAQHDTADIRDASVQTAMSKVQQARAEVSEAKANHQQVSVRTHDSAAMQAAVKMAQANVETAKLQLSYTEVLAPQDGTVTRRTVENGAFVSQGQTLLTIVPTHDIWVTANYKETQLRHVKPGDRAAITVDQTGKTISGHVDSIANATGSRLSLLPPENATGNFVKIVQRIPVKIVLDPADVKSGVLGVGANVDATIYTR
jgi:membrane fusion protein (multidrug efflux system)